MNNKFGDRRFDKISPNAKQYQTTATETIFFRQVFVFRYEACELGLKELLSRFAGSRHVGRVHAERLQAAVQRLPIPDAIDYTTKFFDGRSSNLRRRSFRYCLFS